MTHNPAEALRRLLSAARLLYGNSASCARLHHGSDADELPGWLRDCQRDIRAGEVAVAALSPAPAGGELPDLEGPFQDRVHKWLIACFGHDIASDKLERGDRLLEEVLELLQSNAYPRERIGALERYVYERPAGEPHQELGGVAVTLAAYCWAHGLDVPQAAEDELARIWTKVEKIRAKQAAKPTGSALPVAVTPPPSPDVAGVVDKLTQRAIEAKDQDDFNFFRDVTTLLTTLSAERERLPADVVELVIAARIVAYEDQSKEALKDLDKAAEAFSERVPWENEPDQEEASA